MNPIAVLGIVIFGFGVGQELLGGKKSGEGKVQKAEVDTVDVTAKIQ